MLPPDAVVVEVGESTLEQLNEGAWHLEWSLVFRNTTTRLLVVVVRGVYGQTVPERSRTEWPAAGMIVDPLEEQVARDAPTQPVGP